MGRKPIFYENFRWLQSFSNTMLVYVCSLSLTACQQNILNSNRVKSKPAAIIGADASIDGSELFVTIQDLSPKKRQQYLDELGRQSVVDYYEQLLTHTSDAAFRFDGKVYSNGRSSLQAARSTYELLAQQFSSIAEIWDKLGYDPYAEVSNPDEWKRMVQFLLKASENAASLPLRAASSPLSLLPTGGSSCDDSLSGHGIPIPGSIGGLGLVADVSPSDQGEALKLRNLVAKMVGRAVPPEGMENEMIKMARDSEGELVIYTASNRDGYVEYSESSPSQCFGRVAKISPTGSNQVISYFEGDLSQFRPNQGRYEVALVKVWP